MTQKKTRMKYTVEIIFEGWGDKDYPKRFQEVADEAVKELRYDVTSCSADRGSATVFIKKPSKVVFLEVLP